MQFKKLFIIILFFYSGYLKANEPNRNILSQAKTYYNQGISFGRIGKLDSALYYTQKVVELLDTITPTDTTLLANTYQSLGIINKLLGKYEEAIIYYNKAEKIYKETNNDQLLAYVYGNMANIYFIQQDYVKAKDFHQRALVIFQKDSIYYKDQIASIFNNLGNIYKKKKDYNSAIEYYKTNLKLKENNKLLYTSYGNLAICYSKTGNQKIAEVYYLKAIKNAEKEFGSNNMKVALYYLNYADFLSNFATKDEDNIKYYNRAISIYKNNFGEKHPDLSMTYNSLGEFYLKNNQLDSALFYFQKSLIAISPEFNDLSINSNPEINKALSKTHLLSALKNKAFALSLLAANENSVEYYKISLAAYDKAIETINQIRSGYISQESKLFLAENENETFKNAFETCYKLYQLTKQTEYLNKAFYYSEAGKSAVLTEALKNTEALNIGGIPDSLIIKEKKLEKNIWGYEELIYEENKKKNPDQKKLEYWNKYLFEKKQAYDNLADYLEKNFTNYYRLKHSKDVFTVQDLQKKLLRNDVFIEYFFTTDKLYTFLIKRNESILVESKADSNFHRQLKKLLVALSNNNFSNHSYNDFNEYQESSFFLYKVLLKPFEEEIKNKNIIIIPAGKLAYLPFDVLTSENKHFKKINYKELSYLLYQNTFDYSYSASFLFENKHIRKVAPKSLAAFAPIYKNPKNLQPDSISFRQQYREMLFPLKGIKEEAQKVSEIIGGDEYLDSNASEKKFKEVAPNYDILHLAMHTIMDDQNPMYSKMAFSQEQDNKEDGFLNTHELYNMKLNSRMAVLSSCNSGSGKLLRGEGVMSLARGFAYAGCPSIIMTLWSVEDKSGVKLMTSFYKYLEQGKSKSESLKRSKIDFIQQADQLKSHPYFWSGYVVIGNNEPLFKSYNKLICLGVGIILILFIAGVFIRRRKINSNS